jgi:methylmalonyl-CoA mutase C-terminal domain/subunit
MALVPRVFDLLEAQGQSGLPVLLGGIIPDEDIPVLRARGVTAIFGPGTTTDAVVAAFEQAGARGEPAS